MTDMIIKGFGSAPIRREGERVMYDSEEQVELVEDILECEKDIEFGKGSYDAELDDA